MKKETTTKSKLWIWIVAAAVLLLAVVGVVLALVLGGQNNGPAVDPVTGPRPELYWNLDREFYTANSQTGLSTREADANGQFKMRFAYNGEVVELVIIDKKLVNIIDTQDVLGLTFDENGVVIGQTNVRELATEVGKKIYVKKATADTIIANSSMAMNGMELNLAMGQYAEIYDLRPDSETLGKKMAPTDLQVMDCMTVYSNAAGDITHIYLHSNSTRSKLYWRANMWVSASVNKGGLVADENGVYTLPYYCEGELVNVKTKDPAMVDHYAGLGKHNGFTGLIFDDDGYAIDVLNATVGIAGQQTFFAMDVESIEGNYVKLKNNWSTSGAMNWEGAIPEETPVYDVSSWAYSEGVMGQKISVKDLRVGDRITMFSDMEGNPIEIGITLRRVDLKPMFNNSSKYDASTRSTTRVKDADGYWVYTFISEKGIEKYKTKDQELANFIDSYPERVFGIVTKGEIIVKAYEYECIYGYTRFSTALYVDAINGTIISCSDNKKANAYTAVLSEDYKVLDISGDSKQWGQKIKLQEGDCMISFRNTNKEVCMIYVTKRSMGGKLYVNTTPDTGRVPVTKNDKGEDIKNPYWEFQMTDINGKKVTLQLPTGKKVDGAYANKYLQSRIDSASRGIIALEVSGKTIKDAHTVGNMASGNSVGTVIITKAGTNEFEYKTAAKPNDEASIYPGWTGKEGLKMINISATIKDHHGEKLSGGMKVNDVYYMVRNRANETVAMFLYGRGLHSDFFFVKNPQGYVDGKTLRTPNANGYYVFDVMYQGKPAQVQTKSPELAAQLDAKRAGAALKLDKSTKPFTFTAVADYTGTNDAFKSEVSNWDVSAVSGGNVTLKLNIPTATTEVGITQKLNVSGAKIYNISPDADENFGKTTKLQKNDRVRIFSDKNGKITYVLVTVRNGVKTALCEHCNKKVTWNPVTANSGIGVGNGHYYIFDNYDVVGQMAVSSTSIDKYEVVIDLNGKTVTQIGNNSRIFMVAYEGKTLTLMDSVGTGVAQGYGNSPKGEAGNANIIQVSYGGTLNILSGTYKMLTDDNMIPAKQGGVLFSWSEGDYARNKVNIKGGTIIGGEIKHPVRTNGKDPLMKYGWASGGALYGQMTDFTMSGGTIKDGHADRGGNVYLGSTATFTMTGGTIENGIAKNRGGNFYGATGSQITINGGKVIGGSINDVLLSGTDEKTGEVTTAHSGQQGGNIFGYKVTLKGGEISGGSARTTGGNIFLLGNITETKNDVKVIVDSNAFTMTGGKLANGTAASGGGNLYIYGGEGVASVSGGEIDDSGVTMGPETTTKDEQTVVVTTSTLSATGGKIGSVTIGNECAVVVGGDAQIDYLNQSANAKPMSVAPLSKNAKIYVNASGRFAKAAAGEKGVDLDAYANNQIVSADKQMGTILVETDEKNVKWLATGIKGTVEEVFGSIIEAANKMTTDGVFAVKDGAEPAVVEAECPYCKETAQWAPLTEKILKGMTPNNQNSYVLDTHTHYYLAEDVTLPTVAEKATRLNAAKGATICLHLNGKNLDQNATSSTMGAILIANGATVTIMGEGNVTGAGLTYTDDTLGALYGGGAIDARGTVNILGGTYKSSRADRPAVAAFGAAGNGVKINMYAGTITKGAAADTSSAYSSNVRLHHASQTFNMYGGTIEGGIAENGGNLRMHGGTFNLNGGTITGGTSANLGGNVCVRGGTFNLISGEITGGSCASSGGGIGLVSGTLNISGGKLSGATGKNGGLIYVYGGTLNITDGELADGVSTNAGASIRIAGGTNTISGGTIAGGVFVQKDCALTVEGNAKIGAENNGLQIQDGAELLLGKLTDDATMTVTASGKFAKVMEGAEDVDLAAYANKQVVSGDKRMGTITVETDKDNVKWLAVGAKGTVQEIFGGIVEAANKMTTDGVFAVEAGTEPAVVEAECPYCMETVQWAPLTENILKGMTPNTQGSYLLDTHTHYYLAESITLQNVADKVARLATVKEKAVCLHLNGKDLEQGTTSSTMGAIQIVSGSTLTIMGEGNVTGAGLSYTDATLGTLFSGGAVDARGTVNILGGTYKSSRADRPAVAAFGAAGNGVVINMYAGTITKGAAADTSSATSSNVRLHHAVQTFNMYGGTIEGGKAENGGNLRMQDGTFNMYSGTITGGTSKNLGGNICVRGGTFNLIDGEITNATTNTSGGSIGLVSGKLNISGGKISGGTATYGGLIYVAGGALNITGGEFNDGIASSAGATIRVAGGTNTISGGTISGGVYLQKGVNLTVSGDAKIGAEWSGLWIADGGELLVGKLSETASLAITAEGKFAKAAEDDVDLKSYIGKQIVPVKPDLCVITAVKDDQDVQWLSAANSNPADVYGAVVDKSAAQVFTGATMEETCEYCGKKVTWTGITQAMVDTALAQTNGYVLDTAAHTHYFLAENIDMPAYDGKPTRLTTTANTKSVVCLHLNGKNLDQKAGTASANGVIFVANGTTVNIMGNGIVTGTGVSYKKSNTETWYSGALDVRGTANIFGGAYMSSNPDRPAVALFSEASGASKRDEQLAARVINMFGGTITAGAGTTEKTGASNARVNCTSHVFNMYGGTIENGVANRGGNLRVLNGTFNMYGGEITGGTSANLGGNINMESGTFNLIGGSITGGTCASSGGSIGLVSGTLNISGGTISGATGKNGGLIYVAGGALNITGGELKDGVGAGGNILIGGGTVSITGATISGGKTAATDGEKREITVNSGKALTLGKVTLDSVVFNAGTVTVQDGTVATIKQSATGKVILPEELNDGTVITLEVANDNNKETALTASNAKAAEFLEKGYVVSADPGRGLAVNANNEIYKLTVQAAAAKLSAVFAAALPEGKDYHEAYCPACGKLAQWVPITDTYLAGLTPTKGNFALTETHYYLAQNIDMPLVGGTTPTRLNANAETGAANVCLHLNGKKLDQKTTSNTVMGVILINKDTTMNLMGDGEVIGAGLTASSMYSGAVDVRGIANIYGGTYKSSCADRPAVAMFSPTALEINMYAGTITKGTATTTADAGSSNVWLNAATHVFNMYGGTIENGIANRGGNVRIAKGTFNLHGGTIKDGTAANLGGNINVAGGILNVSGGAINGGSCASSGGSIGLVGTELNISGGTISGGTGKNGGLIYVAGGALEITGGVLKDGVGAGGNILIAAGTNTITGGTISGGKTATDETGVARDVTVNSGKALTLGKDASIEKLYVGGTVTVQNGTVATVELAAAGRVAFASDVAAGTEITVIAPATQTIATVENAANYVGYFKAGVTGATITVKDGTTNEIVMTIPAQG